MSRVITVQRLRRAGLIAAAALGMLASVGAAGAAAATLSGTGVAPVYTDLGGEANNLRVTQQPGGVTKWDEDQPIISTNPHCVVAAGDATCTSVAPGNSVSAITINLGDGIDATTFTNVSALVVQNGGGAGDTLRGTKGQLTSNGGPGNDTLIAGTSSSELNGGDGDDSLSGVADGFTLMSGGLGSDTFIDTAGIDRVNYAGAAAVTVTLDGVANDGIPGENDNVGATIDRIIGSGGDDTITGGATDNQLEGNGGNDTLSGGGGDDRLAGGDGTDTMSGGDGDDIMSGGSANDTISGGADDDRLSGSQGNDALDGGAGDDSLENEEDGNLGADDLRGGDGFDAVILNAYGPEPDYLPVDLTITLDDVANDGQSGEGDNVHGDVEDVTAYRANDTITGNAAPQVIKAGQGNDSIDGGAGNDILFGDIGNDMLRARDGFADHVSCGPGTDSAIVDTLDVVSADCESVDRVDAGNANDTPEDRPPTVAFTTPAEGAKLPGRAATVSIAAGDDKAVARVVLLDDGRMVGSDTTAPYEIAYQPNAGDIGANSLIAIAYDSSEQTATAVRAISIGTFAPRSVSVRVSPSRDRTSPYRFTAKGSLLLPAGVSRAQGCAAGTVRLEARRGGRVIAKRSVKLKRDCSYSASVRVRSRGRAAFKAVFSGNTALAARSSATRNGRAG